MAFFLVMDADGHHLVATGLVAVMPEKFTGAASGAHPDVDGLSDVGAGPHRDGRVDGFSFIDLGFVSAASPAS